MSSSRASSLGRTCGRGIGALLAAVDAVAAGLLFLDLLVVSASVLSRYALNSPIEWSDDAARELMVASSFFGAAGAIARGNTNGHPL